MAMIWHATAQAYGAMGWRVGYFAYPDYDGDDALGSQILKIQDTIPICPSTLSQHVALVSLTHGDEYVRANIDGLAGDLLVSSYPCRAFHSNIYLSFKGRHAHSQLAVMSLMSAEVLFKVNHSIEGSKSLKLDLNMCGRTSMGLRVRLPTLVRHVSVIHKPGLAFKRLCQSLDTSVVFGLQSRNDLLYKHMLDTVTVHPHKTG